MFWIKFVTRGKTPHFISQFPLQCPLGGKYLKKNVATLNPPSWRASLSINSKACPPGFLTHLSSFTNLPPGPEECGAPVSYGKIPIWLEAGDLHQEETNSVLPQLQWAMWGVAGILPSKSWSPGSQEPHTPKLLLQWLWESESRKNKTQNKSQIHEQTRAPTVSQEPQKLSVFQKRAQGPGHEILAYCQKFNGIWQ